MATDKRSGNNEFLAFLRDAPTLEEASSQDTTEITGAVSRTEEGKFAITTGDGQTLELEVGAVQRFRPVDSPGFARIATLQVSSEALKNASLRPIKPLFKEMIKDPIKDVVGDGKYPPGDKFPPLDKHPPLDTVTAKDLRTDPLADHKGIATDFIADHKGIVTDPTRDKLGIKDPIFDPKHILEGTGPGDPITTPDPTQGIDPATLATAAAAGQGPMPFAMQTPHQAPAHLLAMQGLSAGALGGAQNLKPIWWDKLPHSDKIPWLDTRKEIIHDTIKELIHDTRKEMIFDPPNTLVENIPDPRQQGIDPAVLQGLQGMQGFF